MLTRSQRSFFGLCQIKRGSSGEEGGTLIPQSLLTRNEKSGCQLLISACQRQIPVTDVTDVRCGTHADSKLAISARV